MSLASEQLDRRFKALAPFVSRAQRPAKGWVRAVREALGMTTAQLAQRMDVSQPRISEMERAEVSGHITVRSLERAAEALGCRLVYVLMPQEPLADVIDRQADRVASRQLAYVEQTMTLEDQAIRGKVQRERMKQELKTALKGRRGRIWIP